MGPDLRSPPHGVGRLVALLAVLLGLCGLGCGAETRADRIVLWHSYRGAEQRALEQALSEAGVDVDVLAVPHDAYASKLSAAIPLGEGPDLFIDAHERLEDYRARGLVAPVQDALGDPSQFTARAVEAVSLAGEPYAVPLSLKCLALYVNPALVGEVPEDLEAFAGLKLPPGVFPLVYQAENAYQHAALLHALGGNLLAEGDDFGFVGPVAERSLALARRLLDLGIVPRNADGALVTQLFASGRAAMAISGPWLASDIAESGLDYRVTVLPRAAAGAAPLRPFLTVEAVMLSPRGAERPEVRRLAATLAGAPAGRLRQEIARTVSARTDVLPPEGDTFLRAFAEQAEDAVPMPTSAAMRAVWEPANKAIKKALRGEAEVAPVLDEAKRRYDDVRRELPPPASPAPLLLVLGALLLWGAYALVRRAREPAFREKLRASLPGYRYLAHAVVAVGLLVFVPLFAGAAISLFAGRPGDMHYVGLANFVEILTARGGPLLASGSFYAVLLVTVLWTVANVALHLGIGVVLGVLLSRPLLRMRAIYRVLLIVPWAVPSYVTALAWKGMFHRQFGAVTALLQALGVEPIDWFARFSTAFAANLATNVWLGFPFMMVVTLAALTSVPKDVLEAAEVDGANRLQRFFRITVPIVRPSMLPAVVLGAVWTFNMFNVVYLVSGGEPDGQTEILVSEAYRWAFTRQAQYGYAAAYAVLIFLLLYAVPRLPSLLEPLRTWVARGPRGAGTEGAA